MSNIVSETSHSAKPLIIPLRLICIAVDSSDSSKQMVSWAVKNLINPDSDEIVLINVREMAMYYYGEPALYRKHFLIFVDLARQENAIKKVSREILNYFVNQFAKHGIKNVRFASMVVRIN